MPFSSFNDPEDLARAFAAVEAVWSEVKETVAEPDYASERARIAFLVASCAPLALDEDELKENVLLLYRQRSLA